MGLRLYNTLTRQKEAFTPLDPARVRMYVCGPTVYDRAHIGNARPVIVFDVLFRLLRHLYGPEHVTYVRNITDVDDKINARAAERGISIGELTKTTYQWFQEDVAALGCLEPTFEPRATEYVPQMIKMIELLIATGHAYPAEGHVLFDVSSKPDYGKLSNRSVDDMIAGARVEVAPYKKNPMDFVLWKPSPPELPGWDSPWGRGRPGWHIECSAMGEALLGTTFDIHGGGIDLAFPHHENEIAQSECAHGGAPLARVWMHNGFVQMEGEKMAKSVGNVVTISDLLHQWHGEVLRLQMLMTHYRQPISWMAFKSAEAEKELWEWATALMYSDAESDGYLRAVRKEPPKPSGDLVDALLDDLNTPEAITVLRSGYKRARENGSAEKVQFLKDCEFLGLFRHNKLWVHQSGVTSKGSNFIAGHYFEEVRLLRVAAANGLSSFRDEIIQKLALEGVGVDIADDGAVTLVPLSKEAQDRNSKIKELIKARSNARKVKRFEDADRIRNELAEMGVELEDMPDGTTKPKVKVRA